MASTRRAGCLGSVCGNEIVRAGPPGAQICAAPRGFVGVAFFVQNAGETAKSVWLVDVNYNLANLVIGARSFSDDPRP